MCLTFELGVAVDVFMLFMLTWASVDCRTIHPNSTNSFVMLSAKVTESPSRAA